MRHPRDLPLPLLVLLLGSLLCAGESLAGNMFRGFDKDGRKYGLNYKEMICTVGVVAADGSVTNQPHCTPQQGHSPGFGNQRRSERMFDGRLRTSVRAEGNHLLVVAKESSGTEHLLLRWDAGEKLDLRHPMVFWHSSGKVVAVEYQGREEVVGFDVSASLARMEQALGPLDLEKRLPMWGGVWKGGGGDCWAGLQLELATSGTLAAVINQECMGVKQSKKANGSWRVLSENRVQITIDGLTQVCDTGSCAQHRLAGDFCLRCGTLELEQ